MEKKIIYLDNAATTKVDEKVVEAMEEFFSSNYGNISSKHFLGKESKKEVEVAREKIARYVGADTSEIIFTSGGTESNNLALKGVALGNPDKKHIITSVIEHPSVLETCESLKKLGYEIDFVGINEEGFVNVEEVASKIREDTLIVSIMYVNNEIGTIQPIKEIGELCKERSVLFHVDAVQSFTKVDIDVSEINVDLFSVSGHKIHGPKGIGFLYVKRGVKISPILDGGGQERGLRSGTENVPGIIGLAEALDIEVNKGKIEKIRDKILEELLKIPGTMLNGSKKNRIYNNISISFYGIEGEGLMLMLDGDGVLVSTGSACASSKLSESHVLKALGMEDLYIHGSIRLTLGEISEEEADYVIEKIKERVLRLREISPFKLEEKNN